MVGELMKNKAHSPKIIKKDWGQEVWMANNLENNYCGKIISIGPGCSTSLHFHSKKHETFFIVEGSLELHIIDTETAQEQIIILEVGDTYVLERNVPHKLASTQGCELIEISTYHLNEDSYRISR
jgi:mannose-6-phosphate isomerase-like protein (cupin superfamily)